MQTACRHHGSARLMTAQREIARESPEEAMNQAYEPFLRTAADGKTKRHLSMASILGSLMALAMLLVGMLMPGTALAVGDDLQQTIDPNQQQGVGHVVLEQGHIDFGPTLATGKWKIQIHDDTGDVSYWRMPSDVVMHVNDKAIMPMPSGDTYSFIGEQPGTPLWVIPQTQNPDVVWVGWNTQEPRVMDQLQRGMTLSLDGVQGPGDLDVYLENGNMGAPQLVWTNKKPYPQNSWIEVNAHTHVNWIFHKQGVYKVKITASGDLKNGQHVSDTDTLRFAVGNATDPQTAFDAASNPDSAAAAADAAAQKAKQEAQKQQALAQQKEAAQAAALAKQDKVQTTLLIGVIVAFVALAILIIVLLVWIQGRRSKRAAMRAAELKLAAKSATPWAQTDAEPGAESGAEPDAKAKADDADVPSSGPEPGGDPAGPKPSNS
jgi:putative ABC transporter-associated repeat protein